MLDPELGLEFVRLKNNCHNGSHPHDSLTQTQESAFYIRLCVAFPQGGGGKAPT
jgi:hypothetical protein